MVEGAHSDDTAADDDDARMRFHLPSLLSPRATRRLELAPRLLEKFPDIGGKGPRDLDMEGVGRAAPEHDLGLAEERPRRHPHGRRREIEIEWAAGVECRRRLRPADEERRLAMAGIDERMRFSERV